MVTAIGRVYQQLVLSEAGVEHAAQGILDVFSSFISDAISDFNSSVYYSSPDYLLFATHINQNSSGYLFYKASEGFSTTGVPGIEPGSGVLETLILPMNYTPIRYASLPQATMKLYNT